MLQKVCIVHHHCNYEHNLKTWPYISKLGLLSGNQGSDTWVIPKFGGKTRWKKTQQKLTSNLIQFQFVTPVVIKDFFMFTASNNQQVMNLQIFRQSKVLANINKSLANEWNQPTSFPTACSNKTRKPSCRWQTRATLAKSLHGLRKSSGVVNCIASLPIDSLPMVFYYVLYSNYL